MQKRLLTMALSAITTISLLYSCTKLDTTVLGADLVTVDNVNTFADTLDVNTTQGIFDADSGFKYDSTLQLKTDIQFLGNFTEPYFGNTEAAINVQIKPLFFPFYFGNANDTVKTGISAGIDSVVLCLSPRVVWGDSTGTSIPQEIEVREIVDTNFRDKTDSLFGLRYPISGVGSIINFAPTFLTPQAIVNKTFYGRQAFRDSVSNQLRIRLNNTFVNKIFNLQDSTTSMGAPNNGFFNDSIFRKNFNGFQIKVKNNTFGNTLYGFSLADGKTRLEFHYKKRNLTAGIKDTVMQAFFMAAVPNNSGVKSSSSVVNFLKRNYSGSAVNAINNLPTTTNAYLQNAPGTFINVSIPDLNNFRNKKDKIVHRAYLQIDQNDAPNTSKFAVPPFLYLDLKDTIPNRYKPVYFDLNTTIPYNPDATGLNAVYHPFFLASGGSGIGVDNFGGRALDRVDAGVGFKRYEINLTRYVQHIISQNYYNYDLRVMAPYNYFYPQYLGTQSIIPFYNPLATGSVRVGAGTTDKTIPRRMKFIIIYSKVK